MLHKCSFEKPAFMSAVEKICLFTGLMTLIAMVFCHMLNYQVPGFWIFTLILLSFSIAGFSWSKYRNATSGMLNHGIRFSSLTNRGWMSILTTVSITVLYILLYWRPEYLGYHPEGNYGFVSWFDPLSMFLKNQTASQWFVYGVFYTAAILLFGIRFIFKYQHAPNQVIRTISVMFFQLFFAFLIPEFMLRMNLPYSDLKNMWPLNYSFFDHWNLASLQSNGWIGTCILWIGLSMIFIISPLLTYFFGKRWYCSWVCGCGGLAETAGDPFRHLSDKSVNAWKLEQLLIYSILLFVILMSAGVLYTYKTGQPELFGVSTAALRKSYGFFIGAAFSGVIGVGFYPLLGSRVWCRFGCPMAALLGIQQKLFSRFRITTNGGQCISCGNCSTYCEMGIDVRSYAQKGQNIVRASCVGCGICATVCPRGVLKLENGSLDIFHRLPSKDSDRSN